MRTHRKSRKLRLFGILSSYNSTTEKGEFLFFPKEYMGIISNFSTVFKSIRKSRLYTLYKKI